MRRGRLIASVLVALAATGGWLWERHAMPVPSFEGVKGRTVATDVVILSREGSVLGELREDFATRRLAWTPLSEVSPAFLQALLETEDRRFAGHPGVDVWAALRALTSPRAGRVRGASTLTMQLVGLLAGDAARGRRSIARKLSQARMALRLEQQWTKPEVLEAYVNLVAFRGELSGLRAASRGLFGKDPAGLDRSEGLLLSALIARPNAAREAWIRRACAVARRAGEGERCGELSTLAGLAVGRTGVEALAPMLAEHAGRRAQAGGERGRAIRTSLVRELQRLAVQEGEEQLKALAPQNVRDAAILVLDNATGETLAYVGSFPETSRSPEVDGTLARRQAGSILKPFLYELALAEGYVTDGTLIEDDPLELAVEGGIYRPRNYDKIFRGPVTVREALASSLNVPAVKVLSLVGVDEHWRRLKDLGFGIDEGAEFFGPSLALGTVDVTLEEVTHAFRDLALRATTEPSAAMVADILGDRVARAGAFGLENYLSTGFRTSVKTGTSMDMRDNWCVGFSDRYTVGVWVGNFEGDPMWHVSGVSGAAPIWMKLMRFLHKEPPRGRVALRYLPVERSRAADLVDPSLAPRITYPTDGLVMAWDPDLAAERQGFVPETSAWRPGNRLKLNGELLLKGAMVPLAGLAPGTHELTLEALDGQVLDAVRFALGRRVVAARRNAW